MRLLLGADSPSGSLLKALQVVATLSGFEESRASIFNLVAKLYEHYGKELKTFSIIVLVRGGAVAKRLSHTRRLLADGLPQTHSSGEEEDTS